MIKILINAIQTAKQQKEFQNNLLIILGKRKKSDYIKVKLPKEYLPMIETIAKFGIQNNEQLVRTIEKRF
jgi:hypothetical protein